MKLEVDGKTFYLDFVHVTGKSILGLDSGPKLATAFEENGVHVDRYTQARICDEGGTLLSTGKGKCHPNDVFNKKLGRKIALSRCLNSAPIMMVHGPRGGGLHTEECRRIRGLVWKQYLAKVRV